LPYFPKSKSVAPFQALHGLEKISKFLKIMNQTG